MMNRSHNGAPSADILASFVAAASKATPLYIEWERESTTNDRPVEPGQRRIRPSTIVRMELVADRSEHARAARRDRREGRRDFRYFTTATLVAYKVAKPTDTHYIDGYCVPQVTQV